MMKRTAVTFALALIGFFASTTHAQATLVTFPAPPDQQPGDAFGTAVAVDNNTAVVTAPNHDDGNGEPGAAYVYTFDGATWTFQQELTPPDADGSGFGMAVDISGDLIAVGAARDNSFTGAVYVFALENNTWSYEAKYLAPDGEAGDAFGFSVALAGDTMAVGATGYDAPAEGGGTLGSSGAVYAFIRTAGEFTPQPVLIPDDIVPGSLLGFSVDVHVSRTIIAGAPFANEQTGAAYHFFSCLCGPYEKLEPQTPDPGAGFGWDVAVADQATPYPDYNEVLFAVSSYMEDEIGTRYLNLFCVFATTYQTDEITGSGQFGKSIAAAQDTVFVSGSSPNQIIHYFTTACGRAYEEEIISTDNVMSLAASETQIVVGSASNNDETVSSTSFVTLDCPQTVFDVTGGDVEGLIKAVNCANFSPEDDEINLQGTYTLNEASIDGNGIPIIFDSDRGGKLTVNGPATIVRDEDTLDFRILYNLGDLTLNSITIENGRADRFGGAIYNSGVLMISNGRFVNNEAVDTPVDTFEASYGGAIFTFSGTTLLVDQSKFIDNKAIFGGAVYANNTTIFKRTEFVGNAATSYHGGALYINGGSNHLVQNSLAHGNTGVIIYMNSGSVDVINSTFANNNLGQSLEPVDVIFANLFEVNFENSILWNADGNAYIADPIGSATINITNSIIFGNENDDPENLKVDPQFVNPATDNYRLSAGSLAIGAGDNAVVSNAGLTQDLAGNPRIVGLNVDIGAYEFVGDSPLSIYDTNRDDIISPSDAIYVLNRIGQPKDETNAAADVDGNGQIEEADVTAVIGQIGQTVAVGD